MDCQVICTGLRGIISFFHHISIVSFRKAISIKIDFLSITSGLLTCFYFIVILFLMHYLNIVT